MVNYDGESGFEFLTPNSIKEGIERLRLIERIARVCYLSHDKMTETSYITFVKMLIERGHYAMLEHGGYISVLITCDRAIANELVRHRLASYAQVSTRYVNFANQKFGHEITVICPVELKAHDKLLDRQLWRDSCDLAEKTYFQLVERGVSPQNARSVLPLSLQTQIVISANAVEWRHIFEQRTSKYAHPDMRAVMKPILRDMRVLIPILFDNVGEPI
jgi:thymidylate synthase (FAD)